MITTTYRSPLGDITLAADEQGLCGLWFEGQEHYGSTLDADPAEVELAGSAAAAMPVDEVVQGCDAVSGERAMAAGHPENAAAVGVLERTWAWLNAYFAGREPRWTPPLHLEGTAFQHAVWVALLSIPRGETVTYGELAERVAAQTDGAANVSARAIGGAVGRNPVSIIVPCHRVVGANGSLTGYAGGLARKRRLLELEGAAIAQEAADAGQAGAVGIAEA